MTACGIPGKIGTDGRSVMHLWQTGRLREIVQYNECDALTTYLLWLRVAHFSGRLTSEGCADEERQLEGLLTQRTSAPGNEHLALRWRCGWWRKPGGSASGSARGAYEQLLHDQIEFTHLSTFLAEIHREFAT